MKLSTVLSSKDATISTIHRDAPVREAVAELGRRNIGALIVLDGDRNPVGMLSERDIVRELSAGRDPLTRAVDDLMTHDIVCGSPEDDVDAVLQTMTARRFRHLPVMDDGRLVGIVTIGDLVKCQLREKSGQLETLQAQLTS